MENILKPKVSIIIPCRKGYDAVETIWHCEKMDYKNKEIILLTDEMTGAILPSHKRDIGIKRSTGDIIAFIDADAYPSYDWLNKAVEKLNNNVELAGVCGPGILPPDAKSRERASDMILRCLPFNYRVKPGPEMYVEDYPTFNLIIWKNVILSVGGFNCDFLTGEDTLLCKRITKDLDLKILYSPEVVVYHHRRPLYGPFFKQIGTYGLHRGYFYKRYPETSKKLVYAIPSIIWGIICTIFTLLLGLFFRR